MSSVVPAQLPAIPATVVGGYLGAGKTTLVNQMLRQANGLRLAVLVNDFGDLAIDADLIESQEDNVINIAGGCVCCSFGSDLIAALKDVRNFDPRPDHLLIEASGVSLPGSIAESVTLVADFEMDSVIVLADAETVRQRSRETYFADTISRQLSSADLILLNKCDLPTEDELAETEAWLKGAFQNAVLVPTCRSELPLSLLIDNGATKRQTSCKTAVSDIQFNGHPTYVSAVIEFDKGVDPASLAQRLAAEDTGLLRSKGHVVGADKEVYTVQTVGRKSEVRKSRPGVDNIGRMVVITNRLDMEPASLAAELGGRSPAE
ncbi:MAG: CobW family GTP-binding protein [Pseudomonadota bacterium]